MHPVLRRILLHGALTAAVLALVGALFAELASIWLVGSAARTAPDADASARAALKTRVPLMLALWGFLFVLVGEVVMWRVRRARPLAPAPAAPPADPQADAERQLNELLAKIEAERAPAAEAKPPEPGPNPHG